MKKRKLGEVLRERGHISREDLSKAIAEQQGKIIHLGELMLQRGCVQKADLVAALAEVTHFTYVDCKTAQVQPEVLKLIPHALAQRACVLPLARGQGRLVVVTAEPQNVQVLDELSFQTGMEISPRLGFRSEIQAAIAKYYGEDRPTDAAEATEPRPEGNEEGGGPELEFVSTSSRQSNVEALQEVQAALLHTRTPAVRLVSKMIIAAVERQASDIHIEPQVEDTAVRIRVDGVLRELQRVPRSVQNSVVSRIKILSDMDIADRRTPQDGRFLVNMGTKKLDVRVSTLPTQYGEKVVMRLLIPSAALVSLSELGMPPEIELEFNRVLSMPQGTLLVTGPTGSGKSTTLYAALNKLRKGTMNIVTVEDPVEYALPGINQVHVNTKAGLTFASSLRSILRQDPNVIMVGEIRDKETAEIALKAAQTGHLVLSTLHTNGSIAAVTRLLDLGIPGFLIASAMTGIIAQRLLRRLCACHDLAPATPEYRTGLREAGLQDDVQLQAFPVGCSACDSTGYKGRTGFYEMLVFNDAVRTAVRTGSRSDDILNLARGSGMKLMQEYALEQVRQGITTLEEVLRIVPFERIPTGACASCGRELSHAFLFCPHCGAKPQEPARAPRAGAPELAPHGAVHS